MLYKFYVVPIPMDNQPLFMSCVPTTEPNAVCIFRAHTRHHVGICCSQWGVTVLRAPLALIGVFYVHGHTVLFILISPLDAYLPCDLFAWSLCAYIEMSYDLLV